MGVPHLVGIAYLDRGGGADPSPQPVAVSGDIIGVAHRPGGAVAGGGVAYLGAGVAEQVFQVVGVQPGEVIEQLVQVPRRQAVQEGGQVQVPQRLQHIGEGGLSQVGVYIGVPHLVGAVLDDAGVGHALPQPAGVAGQGLGVLHRPGGAVCGGGVADDGLGAVQQGEHVAVIEVRGVAEDVSQVVPVQVCLELGVPHLIGAAVLDDAGVSHAAEPVFVAGEHRLALHRPGCAVG